MVSSDPTCERIYRFRHFNFTNEEHAKEPEQIICDSKLWCSDPKKFNDPFDCSPNFVHSNISSDEQVERALAIIDRLKVPAEDPRITIFLETARAGEFNSSAMRSTLSAGMRQTIQQGSVCCFNSTFDDARMWAQYADNHYGYCLEFMFDATWPPDAVPMPMTYTNKRPQIDLSIDIGANKDTAWRHVEASVFTKSIQWKEEREVRVYRPHMRPGLLTLPIGALRKVYLGVKIELANKNCILNAVSRREPSIPVFQLLPHRTEYAFDMERLI